MTLRRLEVGRKIDKFEGTVKQARHVAADIRSAEEGKREEEKRKRMLDEEIELEKGCPES